MYDPVLGKLKEIATPGLQGSGSKDEGVLLGTVRAVGDAAGPRHASSAARPASS